MERHSPLVARTPLKRGGWPRSVRDLEPQQADVIILRGGGKVLPFPRAARPKDTIPAGVRRKVAERDMGMCVLTGKTGRSHPSPQAQG